MTSVSVPSSRGYFGDARCRSIWQWQLLIALSVVIIGVGVALLTPTRYGDWRFSIGMIIVVVLTVGSLGVPWQRIGAVWFLAGERLHPLPGHRSNYR